MKLTREEREKYKAEFVADYSIDIPNGHITEDAADFWLSKIDTILEERREKVREGIDKLGKELTQGYTGSVINGAILAYRNVLNLPILTKQECVEGLNNTDLPYETPLHTQGLEDNK